MVATSNKVNKIAPIKHPPFAQQITALQFPMQTDLGKIFKRGSMIWSQPITGFSGRAHVHFLYNPSTVSADFSLSDASVGATLLFPNAHDNADLRVPLSQTVSFSLIFDRTYELWQSYNPDGTPKQNIGPDNNNPAVVGVLADILQMEQFTGMTVGYTSGPSPQHSQNNKQGGDFANKQGILQLIPSYLYFGGQQSLSFYGYITDWNFQITHWTKNMVPMRCIINISWTMLPPPLNKTNPGPPGALGWGPGQRTVGGGNPGSSGFTATGPVIPVTSNSGRSGR